MEASIARTAIASSERCFDMEPPDVTPGCNGFFFPVGWKQILLQNWEAVTSSCCRFPSEAELLAQDAFVEIVARVEQHIQ